MLNIGVPKYMRHDRILSFALVVLDVFNIKRRIKKFVNEIVGKDELITIYYYNAPLKESFNKLKRIKMSNTTKIEKKIIKDEKIERID